MAFPEEKHVGYIMWGGGKKEYVRATTQLSFLYGFYFIFASHTAWLAAKKYRMPNI